MSASYACAFFIKFIKHYVNLQALKDLRDVDDVMYSISRNQAYKD